MAGISEREQAFENKFKADEEFRFKVHAKATKLFGTWAAGKLGMTGGDIEKYATQVLEADFKKAGIRDVLAKVQADLKAEGIDTTVHHLENEYNVHLAAAKKAMMAA